MLAGKYAALYRGDPGLFGSLAKIAKGAVGLVTKTPIGKVASKFVPGLNIATTAMTLGGIARKVGARIMPGVGRVAQPGRMAMTGTLPALGAGGRAGKLALAGGGAAAGAALAGGGFGGPGQLALPRGSGGRITGGGRRYRRINPLNPKAARRAIRRIKAVRKLTRQIESSLPKRAAKAASPFARRRRRAA